jgi:hypothetical protein
VLCNVFKVIPTMKQNLKSHKAVSTNKRSQRGGGMSHSDLRGAIPMMAFSKHPNRRATAWPEPLTVQSHDGRLTRPAGPTVLQE